MLPHFIVIVGIGLLVAIPADGKTYAAVQGHKQDTSQSGHYKPFEHNSDLKGYSTPSKQIKSKPYITTLSSRSRLHRRKVALSVQSALNPVEVSTDTRVQGEAYALFAGAIRNIRGNTQKVKINLNTVGKLRCSAYQPDGTEYVSSDAGANLYTRLYVGNEHKFFGLLSRGSNVPEMSASGFTEYNGSRKKKIRSKQVITVGKIQPHGVTPVVLEARAGSFNYDNQYDCISDFNKGITLRPHKSSRSHVEFIPSVVLEANAPQNPLPYNLPSPLRITLESENYDLLANIDEDTLQVRFGNDDMAFGPIPPNSLATIKETPNGYKRNLQFHDTSYIELGMDRSAEKEVAIVTAMSGDTPIMATVEFKYE